MKHLGKTAFILALLACFASCGKHEDTNQWKTYFGFTANDLAGKYTPNPDDWDAILIEEVADAKAVRNASADITQTNENTVIVDLYGMPNKLDRHFVCTIQKNDFMFNSGNLKVQVYKNNNGDIRLNGNVRFPIGQTYDPDLGNPANGYMVNTYEYYYFDAIKNKQ